MAFDMICQSVWLEFVCDFGCNKSPGEVGIFQDAAGEGAGLVLRGATWIARWYIPENHHHFAPKKMPCQESNHCF